MSQIKYYLLKNITKYCERKVQTLNLTKIQNTFVLTTSYIRR